MFRGGPAGRSATGLAPSLETDRARAAAAAAAAAAVPGALLRRPLIQKLLEFMAQKEEGSF